MRPPRPDEAMTGPEMAPGTIVRDAARRVIDSDDPVQGGRERSAARCRRPGRHPARHRRGGDTVVTIELAELEHPADEAPVARRTRRSNRLRWMAARSRPRRSGPCSALSPPGAQHPGPAQRRAHRFQQWLTDLYGNGRRTRSSTATRCFMPVRLDQRRHRLGGHNAAAAVRLRPRPSLDRSPQIGWAGVVALVVVVIAYALSGLRIAF